jgi:ParB family transcriptional regulator, chromosome partitioning protein
MGRRFARSASWVSRRLALVAELPETIQEHVRRGELPAHAAMKHLVPLARANLEACERLVAAIAGKGLTNRQIGQLYAAWCDGLPAIRERVLTRIQRVWCPAPGRSRRSALVAATRSAQV